MAEQQNPGVNTNSFSKGMMKDLNESFIPDGIWTHARNAVNNSYDGQSGVIGNEPANLHCITLPYTLIGCVHVSDDQWALFTTDDINSEIGIFDESDCTYRKVINDSCLNFRRTNLITGVFRRRYDCERIVYFDDGLNPTRFIDIDNPPLKTEVSIVNSCKVEKVLDPPQLDCEKIRIIPFVKHPCINLKKGSGSGSLLNGSYQVCIAYTINQVRVTDYIGLSEVQSLFVHANLGSSLEVEVLDIDKNFDEFELVVFAHLNASTIAKRIGYYSTNQSTIYIDALPNELVTVPIAEILLRREPIEKSDALYSVNNYILRVGSYSKTKFNYQPLANKIKANWVAVEYPADYYNKKGNNTGYMRDEQYAFFIRWIYNTGEYSESYHIPGRAPSDDEMKIVSGDDAFEAADGEVVRRWQAYNTATVDSRTSYTLPDGGVVLAKGKMGYWESTEKYPDNKPLIWGDLCGLNIRHHKFPDETCDASAGNRVLDITRDKGNKIVLLGVEFTNIEFPVDNYGNPIASIVGYEILRGSREAHKTILAKGIFNNMREYDIPKPRNSKLPGQKGLYQNFPFNDLREDYFHTTTKSIFKTGGDNNLTSPLKNYRKDILSFHSPDTSFTNPFLNPSEVKFYQDVYGTVIGRFEECYKHPKVKLLNNKAGSIASKLALAIAINVALGKGHVSSGDDPKAPAKVDVAGGEIAPLAVGGAAGLEFVTSAINIALKVASTAIDVATMVGTTFMISDTVLRLMNKLAKLNQHAIQYNSYGFYNESKPKKVDSIRRKAKDAVYVNSDNISFGSDTVIANTNRPKFVVVKLNKEISNPSITDNSRVLVNDQNTPKALYEEFATTASSHYGALKIKLGAQYGQIDAIKQMPVGNCILPATPNVKSTSSVLFGGDIYITRFTEKNSMIFFNSWLLGEPDEAEFDYRNYGTIPYTRFWMDSTQENYQDLDIDVKLQSPLKVKLKKASVKLQSPVKVKTTLAQNKRSLNRLGKDGKIEIRNAYFYLFNSGVRDFFVESEINLAYRDWEDTPAKRHYSPGEFTDLSLMFRSDLIREHNYYRYDYSLSISKLVNARTTWGTVLSRDFDPSKAETCFSYYPNRVLYSLPQQTSSKKDSWRIYLPLNYKDFTSPVTSVKSINKTGALFMMARQSPMQFMGVESFQTDSGTKVTIGDGALFSGPDQLQAVVNSDTSYEYGSCQNKYSVISCTHGVFWVSQDQGKIFQYAGGVNEISRDSMKWWFAKYLPSELLKVYPTYPLYDNPVNGIGVQTIYDNTNEIVYFTKKDYRPVYTDLLLDGHLFYKYVNGVKTYYSFDSEAFEDASWTISYDPKSKMWVSFHDWKPTMLIPGKAHFMSVNMDSIWKHNSRCDKYCNFYGADFPFEVEFVSTTGQTVTTVRNIEYVLEAYKTYNNCRDKFHLLDENFDQAMIYNSEQISGLLELKMKDKSNPTSLLNFPQINIGSIKIQCSKEENKYRFNQFWDITNDRGEFTHKEIPMFNTRPNGYQFDINARYVNYKKSALERKKFRHMINRVLLRKVASNDVKMLFKLSNQKILLSPR